MGDLASGAYGRGNGYDWKPFTLNLFFACYDVFRFCLFLGCNDSNRLCRVDDAAATYGQNQVRGCLPKFFQAFLDAAQIWD